LISFVALDGKKQRKLGLDWCCCQLRQIYADYNVNIPLEKITLDEVRFFYNPMIPSLCKLQKEIGKGR